MTKNSEDDDQNSNQRNNKRTSTIDPINPINPEVDEKFNSKTERLLSEPVLNSNLVDKMENLNKSEKIFGHQRHL